MAETRQDKPEPVLFRWIDYACEVSGYLSGIAVFLATLTVCYAVALRSFGHTTIWQTEFAVYLLIFVTFIGGAYGLKHGSHVRVDLLLQVLPARAEAAVRLLGALLSLIVIAVVLWKSYDMWWRATTGGWGSGTAWNPPLTFPYAVLPLGMLLIALEYLVLMVRDVRDLVRPSGTKQPGGASEGRPT